MSNRKVAFSMLLLLLVQVVVPIIPADATSGRSSPDFNVSVMTFSSGGSIDDAGQIKLHLVITFSELSSPITAQGQVQQY